MRIVSNPEKKQLSRITYKPHRVIVPVYIPDSKEDYFKNLFEIFKISINSLINTTDKELTNITIINNKCKPEVTNYIDCLVKESKIDKHVKLSNNYGKVYTVLTEARASLEPFITISDADVFFYNNFINMGVKNPVVLYRIAKKLLRKSVQNYNKLFPNSKIHLTFLDLYIFPQKKIKNIKFILK